MSQPLTALEFPANIWKLNNGLTVIHQRLEATPVVALDVWVKAGATLEPDSWSGMAHFLEHMIFKGTDAIAPVEFDQIIENRGGVTNAATSHDYAHFYVTAAANYLAETTQPLAELLLRASIPDSEFDRERDVVLEEIRQAQDDPDWLGFQAMMETVYQRHPYRRSVLGTEELLMSLTPHEMRCFHRSHYQPENMTVVIVGGIEEAQAMDVTAKAFGEFSDRWECPKLLAEAEAPMVEIRRQELHLPRLEQARLMMAWTGPGVEQLESACGLDLLSVLLADGRSSRLVRELREELQWVEAIESSFSLQRESSLFTISAVLEAEDVEKVEALICDRLWELQSEPVSEVELLRCKRLLCNDFAFSIETPGQLAGLYGYYNTIAKAELAFSYPTKIQALQSLDIQRLAQKYLSPKHYAAVVLKPI
ncbi:pitrilysin family protein [Tychonema sp. BBK16]|uniref:M16 family metallopeptidase n=1 Tax=Tychonema sp. BBK16 TaxID=2699888 RepID=UPI001F307BFB|nr:pitrilysin family protein [Tychonema sp. BBK16]MCF6371670.1 insulinase family protein [Tychonema sp. BBK16]